MPHDPRKLLHDIFSRAESMPKFTRGKDFAAYQGDEILRLPVERQFEIIGEAVSRLLHADAALAARITDYRNSDPGSHATRQKLRYRSRFGIV